MSEQEESVDTFSIGQNKTLDQSISIDVIASIEKRVIEKRVDYITAACELAKELGWDPSWLAPYINGALKEKLRIEGEEQGLLKCTDRPKAKFQ